MGLKDFGYYSEVDLKYPNKDDFKTYYVYRKGEKLFEGNKDELADFAKNRGLNAPETFSTEALRRHGFTVEIDVDELTYKMAREAYGKAMSDKATEFYNDLLDEHDLKDGPKVAKAYQIAWEHGHSSGFGEVANWFSELVDLIK